MDVPPFVQEGAKYSIDIAGEIGEPAEERYDT